ncbi:MAG: hypothetical protein AMJ79_06065, partial [Phycisphaerae bacterium SM23_30]
SIFEISPQKTSNLAVGEPVIALLTVSKRNETTYSFNQTLQGRLGERISLLRNDIRPRPPRVHIKNEDGSYERTYTLEYG